MRINIQTKIFFLLAGLTAVILTGVLLAITDTVSTKVEEEIITEFNNTQNFFQKQQSLIYDRLVESCYLIGENSTFKASVEVNDPGTVYFSVEEFANYAKVDLFIVTDERGKMLAKFGEPDRYGDDLTLRPGIARALAGDEPSAEQQLAELWALDDNLYQVATVPLYFGDRIIGTISLGSQITQFEAEELKGASDVDISLFLNNEVVASTLIDSASAFQDSIFTPFISRHQAIIKNVLRTLQPSSAFSAQFDNEPVYAFISPLGSGEFAYYLATVRQASALVILSALQENILITAAISLLITLIFAFFLGRTFSRPILRLVKGMNLVKQGELNTSVNATTKDEIGLLTNTFNEMTIGLRERLHLMKYVGSHTIDMIKKSSDAEVALGGDRRELAVLFSDVRGFTAYSENRSPEEVINMLNHFLGFQAEIVDQHHGSVDKFVGDEMVALFIGKDAMRRALSCAVDIQNRMQNEKENHPSPVEIGIGINFGPVVLGNMGATERMDYTVIGSAVNLGARLCSAAKPGQILVPGNLLNGLADDYRTRSIGPMSFKGFSHEIEIVEVLSA